MNNSTTLLNLTNATPNKKPKTPKTPKTPGKDIDVTQLKKSERGWNRFSTKGSSFNFAYKKAAQSSLTSSNLKTGTLADRSLLLEDDVSAVPKDVSGMWNNFKQKLKNDTSAWAISRAKRHTTKIQVISIFTKFLISRNCRIHIISLK